MELMERVTSRRPIVPYIRTIEPGFKGRYIRFHEAAIPPSARRHHRRGHLACAFRPGARGDVRRDGVVVVSADVLELS